MRFWVSLTAAVHYPPGTGDNFADDCPNESLYLWLHLNSHPHVWNGYFIFFQPVLFDIYFTPGRLAEDALSPLKLGFSSDVFPSGTLFSPPFEDFSPHGGVSTLHSCYLVVQASFLPFSTLC